MSIIPEVKDGEIFVKQNSLTNMIKGKRLRKEILDLGIKVEIKKELVPVLFALGEEFKSKQIVFIFHRPESINKRMMNGIVRKISDVVWARYDCRHVYQYVNY